VTVRTHGPAGGQNFQGVVDANATLSQTVRFLSRVRRVGQEYGHHLGLAHLVGRSARAAGVSKNELGKFNIARVVRARLLRSTIVDEAFWYARAGLLQLRHSGFANTRGHPTLGRTSAYYASFYFAQALCRLTGRIPLYLREYKSTGGPGPTVVLSWDGQLPAHNYFLTGYPVANRTSHTALWSLFFRVFRGCPDANPDYLGAVTPNVSPEDETISRNDQTYVPWFSFPEIQSAGSLEVALIGGSLYEARAASQIRSNELVALDALATDPDLGAYSRATLRALLFDRFMRELAERSTAFESEWSATRADIRQQLNRLGALNGFMNYLENELAS
jgi:hypothetical protein